MGERDEARRDACVVRRDAALRFLVAHGGDPDGRPTAENRCVTPLDFSYDAYALHLTNLLEELGADATVRARCRDTTGIPPLPTGSLSRH